VVLSVYNGEEYLNEAIDSILAQTYENLECIIINDGSTDGSLEIIEKYAKEDERIVIISRENRGLIESLNEGIRRAKGEYIARMDADDVALPLRFERQVAYMQEHPGIGICGTAVEVFGENVHRHIWRLEGEDRHMKAMLLFSSVFAHPTVMMRKSLIFKHNLFYDPKFIYAEDFELWTRFAQHTQMANLQEPLLQYRIVQNSVSREADRDVKRRYEVMSQIPLSYFDKMGIEQSEKRSWLHFNLSTNLRIEQSKIDFSELSQYFSLLLKKNDETALFDSNALKKVLGKKWLINLYYRKRIKAVFSKYFIFGLWDMVIK